MCVFEATGAKRSGLRPAGGDGPLWGELRIVGKRAKARMTPINRRIHDALVTYWRDLGDEHAAEGPLLVLVELCTSPCVLAKAVDDRCGYSDQGLCHLVIHVGEAFHIHLGQVDLDLRVQAIHLHLHAFRYAFDIAGAEAGVSFDVRQSYLGHTSPTTSTIYDKAGIHRRRCKVVKLFNI